MKKSLLLVSGIIGVLILSNSLLRSNSAGAPGNYSGFKGKVCTECHSGNTVNDTGGSVTVKLLDVNNKEITTGIYEPKTTYTVEVRGLRDNITTYGFASTIVGSKGFVYGNFKGDLNSKLASVPEYVTHAKTTENKFTYKWTSPDDDQSITIYTAFNFANGDKASTGDFIYLIDKKYVGIHGVEEVISSLKLRNNPVMNKTIIDMGLKSPQTVSAEVYSLQGKKVSEYQFGKLNGSNNQIELNVEGLTSGNYLVKVLAGNEVKTLKMLKY